MSDKRFKWLLIAVCFCVVAVAFIWRSPQIFKTKGESREKLGEYVYVDDNFETIHTSRKCKKLNSKGVTSYRVKIPELDLSTHYYSYGSVTPNFCPNCVSDKDYEKILEKAKK